MLRPLHRWVRRLIPHRVPPRPRPAFRPTLERLEDRLTPTVAFGGQTTVGLGPFPFSLATADFNGDGRPDLAAGVDNDSALAVVLNKTAPGATTAAFAGPVEFASGSQPISVATADFNGDGRPDLVAAALGENSVYVLLNSTAAGATAPSFLVIRTFAVGSSPQSVAAADVNGDGKPDIVVANGGAGTVSVLLNTTPAGATAPTFAPQATFTAANLAVSVAAADFNGDGKPDLAVVDGNIFPGQVDILLNTTAAGATAPSFAPRHSIGNIADAFSVSAGDFNGDGRPDLVVAQYANGSGTVTVLLDTTTAGATAPAFAPPATFAAGNAPAFVAVGDLNGDGRPDLAVDDQGDGAVAVLLNTAAVGATAPAFAAPVTFAMNSGAVPAVADYNADGRPDLAAVNYGSPGKLTVRLNTTAAFASTAPAVVADLPGMGVVEYNATTGAWVQLNPANPSDVSLLAADAAGDVFADYPGYGVFRYVPSVGSWRTVNGQDAEALAVDAAGDAFLSIAGAGVGEFHPDGSGRLLTPAAAALLSADASGDLVADFPGYGVMRRTAFEGVWRSVNGQDAQAVAIDGAGDVFASFAGAGTAVFRRDGSSKMLTPSAALSLSADSTGDLAAAFAGYGVYRYQASTGVFTPLNGTTPQAAAVDGQGDVFASFAGAGTAEFRLTGGGRTIAASAASLLAADPFGDPLAAP